MRRWVLGYFLVSARLLQAKPRRWGGSFTPGLKHKDRRPFTLPSLRLSIRSHPEREEGGEALQTPHGKGSNPEPSRSALVFLNVYVLRLQSEQLVRIRPRVSSEHPAA